jgi:hypothetical protein
MSFVFQVYRLDFRAEVCYNNNMRPQEWPSRKETAVKKVEVRISKWHTREASAEEFDAMTLVDVANERLHATMTMKVDIDVPMYPFDVRNNDLTPTQAQAEQDFNFNIGAKVAALVEEELANFFGRCDVYEVELYDYINGDE